jgi:hypothetical protein
VWDEYPPEQLATCTDAVDTIGRAAPDVAMLVKPHTVAVSWFDLVASALLHLTICFLPNQMVQANHTSRPRYYLK